MAKRSGILPSHRTLLGIEAVIAVGCCQQFLQDLAISELHHNAWKVLLLMAITAGTFGGLLFLLQWLAGGLIDRSLQAAKGNALFFWLGHVGVLLGLFYLTAWVQHLPVWPMAARLSLP
jgi:hypothetical protein